MADKGLKKNLSWNTVGMIMYNLAIWAFSAMILRVLDAGAGGLYAVASSIGNTLYAGALWGMRSYIVSDNEGRYAREEYFSARVTAVAVSVLMLVPVIFLTRYSRQQNLVLITYTVFKAAEAMIELIDCFCQKEFHMEINAFSMIIRSLLYMPAFFLTLRISGSLASGFAVLTVLSVMVFIGFNLKRARQIAPFETAFIFSSRTGQILKNCFPIMVFELLASLIVAIPRLVYERIGSLPALGIYSSVYTFVIFLQLAINILIFTLAPYMAEAYHRHDKKEFRKYLVFLTGGAFGLGLAAEIATLLLGRFTVGLIFGKEAQPYYTYLYAGIISGVSLACTWIVSQIQVIMGHEKDQLYCSVVSTVSCVFLSRLLVSADDCGRMSLVLILTNMIFILTAYVLSRRYQKIADIPENGEG